MLFKHFLSAIAVQRLREQRVGAHIHIIELVERVHLHGRVFGRADGIRQELRVAPSLLVSLGAELNGALHAPLELGLVGR